ncbi:hypothetical protein HYH03_011288 [Edaphochlamys debaryana]|uniref:Major facilitator superfamily (MFS) profile domain-containing protein n=1 Tax=Edaphochlamys debaryana TaxID=47281 RepID=A0A835XXR5_9CHLO|nr:hypothetical protein HYH03_011288 [Edaphochlamys debaryana]|eukprot:KAG2490341.1 hypothetical protein HYH03_011288 [Edaphochlamys debaryana]
MPGRATEADADGANGSPPPGAALDVPPHGPRPPGLASGGGSSVVAAMEIQEALLPSSPAPAFEHPFSPARRRWMVFMFCLVAALLFADQNLLAPNMTEAAEFFGMNEQQKDTLLGGVLMAAFFAVGAPAALVVGWLTDRGKTNRRNLLFWVVFIGETPCLLTYWVKSYWQFFLLRSLTGIAVGGCFPLVFSLLGDLFPPQRRAAISAVVQIATGAGLAVGQALSGTIGPATNWRVPFVVVAAPSLAVAGLMLATTREPPRGAFEEALQERYAEGEAYHASISWAKVGRLLRCPSNALVIAQGLPGSLPWGMVLTYFNDFLHQQKGFTVQASTLVLLLFGAGGAAGVVAGGAGGQWLYNKRKEYQALLAGGCVLLGIGPLYAIINADLQRLGLGFTCFLSLLGGAVASVAGPNLRSVMLNVNEPETRGVALALQSMTDDLGKGLGPALVAALIHAMGRQDAFNVATAGWVPCGFLLASLACCMRKDEAAMQARLARSSEQQAAARAEAAERAAGQGGGITGLADPGPGPGSLLAGREESVLAKQRLLGPGPASSSSAPAPSFGGAYPGFPAPAFAPGPAPPLPTSSGARVAEGVSLSGLRHPPPPPKLLGASGRGGAGVEAANGGGAHGGPGSSHDQAPTAAPSPAASLGYAEDPSPGPSGPGASSASPSERGGSAHGSRQGGSGQQGPGAGPAVGPQGSGPQGSGQGRRTSAGLEGSGSGRSQQVAQLQQWFGPGSGQHG